MHSKMFKRILAGILIFTLTFANPALVTKSFATSIFDKVSNQTGTGKTLNLMQVLMLKMQKAFQLFLM